ncbi:glycosyltransferase family 4 protein [Bythopirellula goksoeyrii]|uniref:D-inositol 3-phosphate glycosyltransferase n=1 Tax=Bythopirellula goksoeyrii TaxID=1400387 RepID=A0A5B9QPI9_9BACT|nr:glycosyltransferase family 4 protein [Bythopirellula goksoeyrii]QEG36041.1 D-inositol 3-phosphate glycosyltransferase [Bythopirellula goksoeyrii]
MSTDSSESSCPEEVYRSKATICVALYSFDVGGSERLGLDLVKYYAEHGANVVCCATRRGLGPLVSIVKSLRIPYLALDLENRTRFGRALSRFLLMRWLVNHRVTCIHAQHFSVYADVHAPAVAAGIKNRIVTEHTAEPLLNDRKYAKLTARFAHKATSVVAINQVVKDALCHVSGIPASDVLLIENGIDTRRFTPGDIRSSGQIRIVWMGRLHPDKDILTALSAFQEATIATNLELRLFIVGDGQERKKAEKFVDINNLGTKVVFEGELNDPLPILQQADFFLMSSRTEGTPLVILEALSCGLPVVATAVGGIPNTITEEVGLLAPAENPSALARCILILAKDRELRLKMGKKAREIAEFTFSVERMAKTYTKLYANLE